MRDLVKRFIKWCLIVLATLTIILWAFIITAYCQHEKHDSLADQEDDIRFKSVVFLNVDQDKVYFKRETKYRIDLGSFVFDTDTKWDRSKPASGCYVAVYCHAHDYLYIFHPCRK